MAENSRVSPSASPEDFERLGVWDPEEPNAQDRLVVLRRLAELGADARDLEDARVDPGNVAFRLAVRPGVPSLTEVDAAEATGMEPAEVRRLYLAAGLPHPGPDEPAYSESDLELIRIFRLGAAIYGVDEMIQLVRVAGAAMARVADAGSSVFFSSVVPRFADDRVGLKAVEFNDRSAELVGRIGPALETLLRHHLVAISRSGEEPPDEGVDTRVLGVGFVDMSGSTALAQQLDVGELSRLVSDFETTATEIVASAGGRVFKFLGDEVMFGHEDPATVCRIALDIFAECAVHELIPPLRCGLAHGRVVAQSGDCFGPVVNLASRLATVADPGTILLSAGLREAVSDESDSFELEHVEPVTLKGFEAPEPTWSLVLPGR